VTRLESGAATDVGLVRSNNQDAVLVSTGLYAVADGMGGHAAGEVASRTAIDALKASFEQAPERSAEALAGAGLAANRAVWEQSHANTALRGMGTTLVALARVADAGSPDDLAIINIGDSRLYLFRDDQLRQLTVDHSLVQELVDVGRISEDQAAIHPQRHVLTRALGIDPSVAVDLIQVEPRVGDRYLLCSDGLCREVSDDQIASLLRRLAGASDAAKELVSQARNNGGSDNISVVVVDVHADDDPVAEADGDSTMASGGPAPLDDPPTDATQILPALEGAVVGTDADATTTVPITVERGRGPLPGRHADRSQVAGGGAGAGPVGAGAVPRGGSRRRGARAHAAGFAGVGPGRRGGPRARKARVFTLRLVAFFVLVVAILGGGAAALASYARSTYYVGLQGSRLVIFRGRPGGVWFWHPTVVQRTAVTTAEILPYRLGTLRAGQSEPSLAASQQFISNLVREERSTIAATSTTVAATTTLGATTTTATTSSPITSVPSPPGAVPPASSGTGATQATTTVAK
jgi:serine/threonine protein phosphatase PrpC